MNRRKRRELPWWLEPGLEECMICEARVHGEALAYCVACDRAMCSVCLVHGPGTRELLCAECAKLLAEEKA